MTSHAPVQGATGWSPTTAAALCPTGALRVVINLGNPVLAQGTLEEPSGITVDIAHDVAHELGVELSMRTVPAARDAYQLLVAEAVDLGFLAIEPAREEGAQFTQPYVEIEGVFAVRTDSSLASSSEVDVPGRTIAVRRGSAYDLYLTRTVEHADLLRGDEVEDVFEDEHADVLSGVRQPTTTYAAEHGLRVLEPAFQTIRQAVAVPVGRPRSVRDDLDRHVATLKASGFVADSLRRACQIATIPPIEL